MLNKLITTIALATASLSSNAFAEDMKFICERVAGVDEWTIYVDLEKQIAGFFDNDNTTVVPIQGAHVLESNPPQTVYTFEGKDTGSGSDSLVITFNQSKLRASVTFDAGTADAKTRKAKDKCRAFPELELEEEQN